MDDVADQPLFACDETGTEKYLLSPTLIEGDQLDDGLGRGAGQRRGLGGRPGVQRRGAALFEEAIRALAAKGEPQNRFAIVLDGVSISAPSVSAAIPGGRAQIEGNFNQQSATELANVLKYGALPLAFDVSEVNNVSATLGGEQLRAGIIAGIIGLALVVLYCFAYYRGLGIVVVASLAVAGLFTYACVVLLGSSVGFALNLPGIAGMIVAIGVTADSFVIYFERIRDEVREGRSLRTAVETGWRRARQTILIADAVSMLSALILFVLAIGSVKGFAFTLGLTTLIDVLVVFMFTKPMVTLLAGTRFFGGPPAPAWTRPPGGHGAARRQSRRPASPGQPMAKTEQPHLQALHRRDLLRLHRAPPRWYILSAVLITLSILAILIRGLVFGIEFRGGADFQAPTQVTAQTVDQVREAVVATGLPELDDTIVNTIGNDQVRVQTRTLNPATEVPVVRAAIAEEVGVPSDQVAYSLIGASWGSQITERALIALAAFLALVALVIWIYFRDGKMAGAALVALAHDLVLTIGIYALVGFTVTPATLIGLLTILGYSLYDTVVVFDKVRENVRDIRSSTHEDLLRSGQPGGQPGAGASINTTVIGCCRWRRCCSPGR